MGEGDDRREATSAVQSPGTARTGGGPCVPQSIQHVVQSGARLTVAHCPRGSVHTSVSEAPEMRSRSAGRPHNTEVRTANQRRAHSAQLPWATPQAAAARNSAPDSPPLRHSCSSQCDDGSAAPPRLTNFCLLQRRPEKQLGEARGARAALRERMGAVAAAFVMHLAAMFQRTGGA